MPNLAAITSTERAAMIRLARGKIEAARESRLHTYAAPLRFQRRQTMAALRFSEWTRSTITLGRTFMRGSLWGSLPVSRGEGR